MFCVDGMNGEWRFIIQWVWYYLRTIAHRNTSVLENTDVVIKKIACKRHPATRVTGRRGRRTGRPNVWDVVSVVVFPDFRGVAILSKELAAVILLLMKYIAARN